jgi:tRNA (mo5U34)-methyltransferase
VAVASDPEVVWYHTLELEPGVVTPGWFDLRPVVDELPWPDVRGKRCLDVATYDGFFAFELERRGAAEVIATDVADASEWDWPPDARAEGPERARAASGAVRGVGFHHAKEALGSSVERVEMNVYQLDPDVLGTFDVVVCGSLMLHLRDPLRALEAIRGVCRGQFLSAETVKLGLSLLHRRRPLAHLDGSGMRVQWWTPSAAGHRRMLFAAGFGVERESKLYSVRFGESHPASGRWAPEQGLRGMGVAAVQRLVIGCPGVPHHAALCSLRVGPEAGT